MQYWCGLPQFHTVINETCWKPSIDQCLFDGLVIAVFDEEYGNNGYVKGYGNNCALLDMYDIQYWTVCCSKSYCKSI